ncbi:hypothetical protein [Candidatus Magnetaquicoccus inordinatus]|uniref:hypothetical protein n=1 Tax=Candidatus Magnetaquicoccus inordinatus TaxID=2496818 RepID=UPI00102ACC5B|nr:hypothetical protein [Candidatus Magnetaquicoccus inordinatus]
MEETEEPPAEEKRYTIEPITDTGLLQTDERNKKQKRKTEKSEDNSDDVAEAAAFLAEMEAVHPAPRNIVTDFQSIFRDLLPLTTLNRESTVWAGDKTNDKQKVDKNKKIKKK